MEEVYEQDVMGYEILLVDFGLYLAIAWLLLTFCAILTALVPSLSNIAAHGKCNIGENLDSIDALFYIPKRYFSHFYPTGLLLSLVAIVVNFTVFHHSAIYPLLVLFAIHCGRRWWECVNITEYGSSQMHIAGYLVGLFHYILVPITLEIASIEGRQETLKKFAISSILVQIVGILLFGFGNYLQYNSHLILFKVKRSQLSKKKDDQSRMTYTLPSGGGFEYCCCPHYFAEILIYLSLIVVESKSVAMWSMLVWVVVNLSVVAFKQYQYYLQHCFEELELKNRQYSILFPFLW